MLEIQNQQSCIIPTCPVKSQGRVIIHTGLVTARQVADMLHTNVPHQYVIMYNKSFLDLIWFTQENSHCSTLVSHYCCISLISFYQETSS